MLAPTVCAAIVGLIGIFFSDGGIQFYKCRRQSGSLFDDTGIGSFIFGISLLFGSVSCKTETDGAFYPGTV